MDKGFIKLNRKFFSHKMWEAARTFSECEAWIDLIQSARFGATEQIERIGGREIRCGRGQYPASNRYLAQKWKWGEHKVKAFLGRLKAESMITVDKSQGMNVITLCKYDVYNDINPANNPVDDSSIDLVMRELNGLKAQLTAQQTTHGSPSDNPNLKKEKKEEERNTYSPYNPPKGYEKVNFDFLDFELREYFFQWLDYKTDKGQRYKNRKSIELCYKRLNDKSGGNFKTAVEIIEQSMANNWNGLFELKEQNGAGNKQVKGSDGKEADYSIGM
ncbi:hypothetical protein CLV62_101279 [Dysgonomonas alginatilytica]|uniref:Uncharacterized protein n=1 Tax=Dysgonomonas alginatilytica TaxID=1605892 RepID=A0A2V3PV65_9BACT|nr:hypothetical protein [Dysgonomonas alginatilytica]PXV69012.1 hypothetical protein CLV62_101279 [Dysgonomonas alginatilytica]